MSTLFPLTDWSTHVNWTQFFIISVPVVAGFVTWFLNERSKRRAEEQLRQTRLYEEVLELLESVFGSDSQSDQADLSSRLNRLFAKLALYAPDDVYREIKAVLLRKPVYGREAKPIVYAALRKSLFGRRTKLMSTDLVDHLSAVPLPPRDQ